MKTNGNTDQNLVQLVLWICLTMNFLDDVQINTYMRQLVTVV